ncbi:MAG: choice-of-anchor A family protein [Inhella sp.]
MQRMWWGLAALALNLPAGAAPALDLDLIRPFSAVFFGDLTAHSDIEGRVAVSGSVDLPMIEWLGYRNPSPNGPQGSAAPSLLVGGDVRIGSGALYNGPLNPAVNSNQGMGPSQAPGWPVAWRPAMRSLAEQNLGSAAYLDLRAGDSAAIDAFFSQAEQRMGQLSQSLAGLQTTGTLESGWDTRLLPGTAQGGWQVFNLDAHQLKHFSLDPTQFGADDWVLINLSASGRIELQADYLGSGLAALADRLVFNLPKASEVLLRSGYGLLLAPQADVVAASSGHWEGTVVARDMLSPPLRSATSHCGPPHPRPAPLAQCPSRARPCWRWPRWACWGGGPAAAARPRSIQPGKAPPIPREGVALVAEHAGLRQIGAQRVAVRQVGGIGQHQALGLLDVGPALGAVGQLALALVQAVEGG